MTPGILARQLAALRRPSAGARALVRPLRRAAARLRMPGRRRPPFSIALVTLVVASTALTGGAIGGLAWRENRAMSRTLVEASMAQTGRLTAAQAVRFLSEAESAARLGPELVAQGLIVAHGGTIIDFIGDGILALFGAPFSRPDDTVRAARCAWAMQRAMDGLNAESRSLGLPELGMGIAVHTGLVVAGNIGGPERIKYGAVGPPVNLASRIQSLAAAGEVLISAPALAHTGAVVQAGPPRSVRVKGAASPVTVHAVLGVADEVPGGAPPAGDALPG